MTYQPVQDPADPRVKDYVALSDGDARRHADDGIFVAEGALVIGHLVRSPYRIRSFLVTERGLRALEPVLAGMEPPAPVYLAGQPVMDAIAGFHFHRGALAAADRRPLPDPSVLAAGVDRLLVVEGVGDHENLGALFRNAAAFGVDAVLLDPTAADPLYRRSVRVSAGHVLRLPFARMPDWPGDAVARLRGQGFEVVALTPSRSADDLRSLRPGTGRRWALVVGAEGNGLSPAALAAADRRVRIAMEPGVDSLNVATAAAVALHHLATGG
jgi:tRNA G18 (ribose-2'-O)-methylase SpoU